LYLAGHLYTGVDFKTALLLRLFQVMGLAFLFVPINTLVYAGVALEKSNAVAGIMNLGRNLGGSIGIAFITTVIARRAQVHQVALTSSTNDYNSAFTSRLAGIARAFEQSGLSAVGAAHRALAVVYRQVELQATQLAYLDAFRSLAIAALLMLPLLFLAKAAKPGNAPIGH
jgi:DHA2 family multidrug resistance protein